MKADWYQTIFKMILILYINYGNCDVQKEKKENHF